MKTVFYLLALLLFTGEGRADSSKQAFEKFWATFPQASCREDLKRSGELRLLFAVPEFRTYVASSPRGEFRAALKSWSTDLLVKLALELEPEIALNCKPDEVFTQIALELKRAYLERLGMAVATLAKEEVDLRFRGLLVPREEVGAVAEKVKAAGEAVGLALLKKVYGAEVELINGVVVVAPESAAIARLRATVAEICKDDASCRFWDPRFLARTVVTKRAGMAAYVPEVGVLFLSDLLFDTKKVLNQIVILHELTHVGERVTRALYRRSWQKEFAKIGGWQSGKKWTNSVDKLGTRNDRLTQESTGSAFAITPDNVYLSKSNREGFVFAKSYDESLKRNSPGEDLADSVAVFKYFPERFCYRKQPFAPKKYEWIRGNVFPSAPELECQKSTK